ncbi:MAG: nucleotide exchange factor GrpE [Candidatus Aminicenantes bacterium RBG_16_63_14]|nr:MAG: nucleotide exchange factor GrpE [Candidatus Aminicenantes bacterium RBG_16_63_14]OGD27606.1 MAG: nucleotide exchange factor GrpE [Candidatus Aminicenantes bacterium RBG_19FT_COMBO_65_30]
MTDEKDKPGDEIEFIPETPPPGGEPPQERPAPSVPEKKEPDGKGAAAEGARHLKEKLKKKEAEVKHLKKELDELKETHLRKLADIENLRKRFEREKNEYQQYAMSGFLLDLLAVTDNFERALQSAPADADGKTFREGVELILRMFQNLLAKNGVQPIVLKERAFDPNFHHAMTVEESDKVEEPEVEEELQKGYLHHDRLLRPTLVKVLVPKKGQ